MILYSHFLWDGALHYLYEELSQPVMMIGSTQNSDTLMKPYLKVVILMSVNLECYFLNPCTMNESAAAKYLLSHKNRDHLGDLY